MEKNEILKEANEALQRTLLMMNYDMKKTLTENVEVILEQTVPCSSNPMSEDDIYDLADDMWGTLQNMQMLFVRAVSGNLNGIENSKEIYNNINNLVNQTVIDDISKTCKPALATFKEIYKERAKKGGGIFSTEPDITKELENLSKDDYFVENVGQRGVKYINAAINLLKTGGAKAATQTTNNGQTSTSWDKDLKSIYKDAKSTTISNIPAILVEFQNSKIYFANNNRYYQYTPDGKKLTQKGVWKVSNGKLEKTPDGSKQSSSTQTGVKSSKVSPITDKKVLDTLDFSYNYPNDKQYVYAFVPSGGALKEDNTSSGTWYAKNIATGKVYNITQNYPSTAQKLSAQFPNGAKTQSEPTQSSQTTQTSGSTSTATSSVPDSEIKGKGLEVQPVSSNTDLSQKTISIPQRQQTQPKQNLGQKVKNMIKGKPKPNTNTSTTTPTSTDVSAYDPYGPQTESLKKSLKKNLIEAKEIKENLMVETNIVKKRFNFIVEGKTFNTIKDQDELVESVISEIGYLKSQGYTSKAINEGLFSMLGSLLGGGAQAVPAVFGEYIASWLTGKLGIPKDSYMNGVIVSLVGNLNISDYDRFFSDCRFASNKIADSLIEGYLVQLQNQKDVNSGASGFIVSALRNSVVDYFTEDKNSLIQILEDKIGEFLCPKLSKLSGAISNKTDEMKAKMVA